MEKDYTFTRDETKDKETKLSVKVQSKKFKEIKDKVYNKLSKDVVITGFRPGKAPRNLIEAKISQEIYEETINQLVPDVTYEIISSEKLAPLNQLHYDIMKMSDEDGIEFNAIFVNTPEIKLADFSKIKAKREPYEVTDKDIKAEIDRLVKTYRPKSKESDEKDEKTTPELTDVLVKEMKLGFDSKDKLLEQIKKELEASKKYAQEQKYLSDIILEAVKASKIEAPIALINDETHRKEHEYIDQITQIGLKMEDFLKSQNKTIEDLRKEWDKESKQRVEQELLLFEVVKANNITVTGEEISKELAEITDEQTKKQMTTDAGIRYITTIILQQKALNFIKDKVSKE